MHHKTGYIKVIRVSEWTIPQTNELPARVVMWKPDDEKARHTIFSEMQYVTHLEVRDDSKVGDIQGTTSFYFTWGHYDMTYGQASADFGNRCRQLGVREHKLVGGLVS